MPAIIASMADELGLSIEDQAIDALMLSVGADTLMMRRALEKLFVGLCGGFGFGFRCFLARGEHTNGGRLCLGPLGTRGESGSCIEQFVPLKAEQGSSLKASWHVGLAVAASGARESFSRRRD